MSWTDEAERVRFENASLALTKKEIKGKKCPKCGYGIESGENKHTVNFSCGHSQKKEEKS